MDTTKRLAYLAVIFVQFSRSRWEPVPVEIKGAFSLHLLRLLLLPTTSNSSSNSSSSSNSRSSNSSVEDLTHPLLSQVAVVISSMVSGKVAESEGSRRVMSCMSTPTGLRIALPKNNSDQLRPVGPCTTGGALKNSPKPTENYTIISVGTSPADFVGCVHTPRKLNASVRTAKIGLNGSSPRASGIKEFNANATTRPWVLRQHCSDLSLSLYIYIYILRHHPPFRVPYIYVYISHVLKKRPQTKYAHHTNTREVGLAFTTVPFTGYRFLIGESS